MARPLMRFALVLERDDDCDCARWLRWRIVLLEPGKDYRVVIKHTITRAGGRWALRRRQRELDELGTEPGVLV